MYFTALSRAAWTWDFWIGLESDSSPQIMFSMVNNDSIVRIDVQNKKLNRLLNRLLRLCIGTISAVCVHLSSGQRSSCWTQKVKVRWILQNADTQGAQWCLTHGWYIESLKVWQSWMKLAHHPAPPPPPPPPHMSLCPHVWHTHSPAPSALQPHTPACTAGVSRFRDEATSDQWAAVRTLRERGGNSPPISPVSTWEPALPQGGAAQPPAVWMNTKQKLSPTGELHESVVVFL